MVEPSAEASIRLLTALTDLINGGLEGRGT